MGEQVMEQAIVEALKKNSELTITVTEQEDSSRGTTKTTYEVKAVPKLPWYHKLWYFLFQYDKKHIKYNK